MSNEVDPLTLGESLKKSDPVQSPWALGSMLESAVDTVKQREKAKYVIKTPDGKTHFPINDCSDVSSAWNLRGHGDIPQTQIEAHIRRAASALGCKGAWNEPMQKSVDPNVLGEKP
jgi:hypothetical protein